MPASIAASRIAELADSSAVKPKLMVPRPSRLISRPERPKCPYAISPLMPQAYVPSPRPASVDPALSAEGLPPHLGVHHALGNSQPQQRVGQVLEAAVVDDDTGAAPKGTWMPMAATLCWALRVLSAWKATSLARRHRPAPPRCLHAPCGPLLARRVRNAVADHVYCSALDVRRQGL